MNARLAIMGSDDIWAIGSDTLVVLDDLTNDETGEEINSATVTAALRDDAGAVVDSPVFEATGSGGRYLAEIASAVSRVESRSYTLEVTAVSGLDTQSWRLTRLAREVIHA